MAAKPSSDSSFAFIARRRQDKQRHVRRRNTLRGCGSKVSTSAGTPRRSASSSARPSTAWWPRCTPSKLPIAATPPRRLASSGASPVSVAELFVHHAPRLPQHSALIATTPEPMLVAGSACSFSGSGSSSDRHEVHGVDAAPDVEHVRCPLSAAPLTSVSTPSPIASASSLAHLGRALRRPALQRRCVDRRVRACRRPSSGRRAGRSRAPARPAHQMIRSPRLDHDVGVGANHRRFRARMRRSISA